MCVGRYVMPPSTTRHSLDKKAFPARERGGERGAHTNAPPPPSFVAAKKNAPTFGGSCRKGQEANCIASATVLYVTYYRVGEEAEGGRGDGTGALLWGRGVWAGRDIE